LSIDVSKEGENDKTTVSNDEISEIKNTANVEKISPAVIRQIKIYNKEVTTEVELNIVGKDFFKLEGIRIDKGELFDESGKEKEAIVSTAILELMHIDKNNFIGEKLSVKLDGKNENNFKIIGLVEDESNSRYISQDNQLPQISLQTIIKLRLR